MQLTSYFMVKEAKYVVEGWAQSSDKLSARKKKNTDLHILSISYSTNLVGHIEEALAQLKILFSNLNFPPYQNEFLLHQNIYA